jgi:hypothetical protein
MISGFGRMLLLPGTKSLKNEFLKDAFYRSDSSDKQSLRNEQAGSLTPGESGLPDKYSYAKVPA